MKQPLFLKLSDKRIIGLFGNIAELHWMTEEEGGSESGWITYLTGEPYQINLTDFQRLMAWASHPDRCVFVQPDEQVSNYQDYQARGGSMTFDSWKEKYQRHQRLVKELDAYDKPPQNLFDKVSELENALFL